MVMIRSLRMSCHKRLGSSSLFGKMEGKHLCAGGRESKIKSPPNLSYSLKSKLLCVLELHTYGMESILQSDSFTSHLL